MNAPRASARLPIESARPIVAFAAIRLALMAAALGALAVTAFPQDERLAIVLGAVGVPWAIAILLLARSRPSAALSPGVALGDLAVLACAEAVAPDLYGPVRFAALFLVVAHAQFHGERIGIALAALWVVVLVTIAVVTDGPVEGRLLVLYEAVFAVAAVSAAGLVSRLRTSESAGRLRARGTARRHIEADARVRRQLAESLHDGPVQELVSLDLMLTGAEQASDRGDVARTRELIHDARELAERNVRALRDEMIGLGPIAFDELSLDQAIRNCAPVWQKRWGIPVELRLEELDLANEICGILFGIIQEAVSNAGRHSGGGRIRVTVAVRGGVAEATVSDDGRGFEEASPLGPSEPGHIGLASMRERAELLGGELRIDSGEDGTTVRAVVPLEAVAGLGSA
jgi:signal transduction histidine kinase